ncbi:Uncharacterized protein M6B38_226700 [Iris pallida]|uniref:Uncharacterized protein n=1 Tax=Iris pallida TaxID=29817 RepID=A0AAX6DUF5_IRIPA|nr:Uncharacterized protein M6B38_226700 [Iris pallida]
MVKNSEAGSPMDGEKVRFVSDHSSLLSLQPWVFRKESCLNVEEKMSVDGGLDRFTGASQAELSPRNVNLRYRRGGGGRGRNCLRSKNSCRYSVKPVVSAGNCLIPQLYTEDFEFGERGFTSASSDAPALRPLVITDGRRIISKSTNESSCVSLEKGLRNEVDQASSGRVESVIGIPPLPKVRSPNLKVREAQHLKQDMSNTHTTCKSSNLQDSPDRILLLCFGINIGVISTFLSNRREVERLNDLLKHNENLVQDLQEELEMKESLTVNELPNEACEKELKGSYTNMVHSLDSLKIHDPPPSFPSQERDGNDCLCLPKSRGNMELSKIEAELEAELERLELDMNATSLEGRISAFSEMDPDLVGDIVQGELRADMLKGGSRSGQVDVNRDSKGTSTTETHDVNYAVSPRELSLRLHEVIQFRLEERVKELENALQCSQKEIEFMQGERVLSQSQRSFSNSENGPSPCKESPTLMREDSSLSQALCLNLSGDALNAYDEAYEEFMRIADTPDYVPYMTDTNNEVQGDKLLPSDGSLVCDQEDSNEGNKTSVDTNSFRREVWWEQMLSRSFSDDGGSDDTDDEEGKLLIQQIIEKTKKGSPLVMHAQRMLYAMED